MEHLFHCHAYFMNNLEVTPLYAVCRGNGRDQDKYVEKCLTHSEKSLEENERSKIVMISSFFLANIMTYI